MEQPLYIPNCTYCHEAIKTVEIGVKSYNRITCPHCGAKFTVNTKGNGIKYNQIQNGKIMIGQVDNQQQVKNSACPTNQ